MTKSIQPFSFPTLMLFLSLYFLGGCQHNIAKPACTQTTQAVPIRPLPSTPRVDSIAQLQLRTTETELAVLTRLEHELVLLEPIVRESERASNHARYQFDYDALRLDLTRIRQGIREYRAGELSQPREIEPIKIEPLSGDYRR